jgi:iron complex outermembrane receptor protein
MVSRYALALCSVASVLLTASPAFAQKSAAAATEADAQGDIIVTARQRAEPLQKVPDSITLLSADMIEKAGINSTADLGRFVPNLYFRDGHRGGASAITVRGLITPQGGEMPIALVVDGVQLSGNDYFLQDLLDVENIQVLQGPQGALYGQGAVAGAVIITTRQPTDEFQIYAKAGYGSGDNFTGVARISGPLVNDRLYFKLLGSFREADGVIKDANGVPRDYAHRYLVRGEIKYDHEATRATAALSYGRDRNGAIYQDYAPVVNGVVQPDDPGLGITSDIVGVDRVRRFSSSLRIEQDIGDGALALTTAYNTLDQVTRGDADWTAADRFSQYNLNDYRLFNGDLRYTSKSDQRLRYVFGAFYQKRRIEEAVQVAFLPGSGRTGFAVDTRDTQRSEAWALFGQLNYDVTSKLELTTALRYDDNNRKFFNIGTNVKMRVKFNKLQPKVSLAYKWTDGLMTYATYAQGFRSGGFNTAASLFAGPIIAAEKSNNYELGFKARLPLHSNLTASFYRIDVKDAQFYFASSIPPSQNTINIKSVKITGGEVQLSSNPIKPLRIDLGVGVSHSEIQDFNGTGFNDGNIFPTVPAYSIRGSISYAIPVGEDLTITPRVDTYERGRLFFDAANLVRSGPINLTDLRLNVETGPWEFSGFVTNVGNTRYGETVTPTSGLRTINAPRTYGFSVSFRH